MIVQLCKEWEEHLDSTNGVDGTVNGVSHGGFYILQGQYKEIKHNFVRIVYTELLSDARVKQLTCSIRACGEWTKMEAFSFGDDSRQSWASVALALYVKAMELANLLSYSTCL